MRTHAQIGLCMRRVIWYAHMCAMGVKRRLRLRKLFGMRINYLAGFAHAWGKLPCAFVRNGCWARFAHARGFLVRAYVRNAVRLGLRTGGVIRYAHMCAHAV